MQLDTIKRHMKRAAITALSVLSFSLPTIQATHAATATSSVAVSATVLNFCTVAALPLAFGNYGAVQLDGTTTVTVLCTTGTSYAVGLDAGSGTGASVSARKMTVALGTETLNYTLYSDSGRSTVWGNTAGTNVVTGTGSGVLQTLTVYGRINGSQYTTAGVYADVVQVTLTY